MAFWAISQTCFVFLSVHCAPLSAVTLTCYNMGRKEGTTYPDNLVLGTRCKIPSIRTEAHTPNVQIPVLRRAVVLKMAHLFPRVDIEDLRASIAAGGHESPVVAEAHTTDYALVRKVVHQIHVQSAVHTRVEDRMPVIALSLEMRRELIRLQLR